jgi:hypothetical protein
LNPARLLIIAALLFLAGLVDAGAAFSKNRVWKNFDLPAVSRTDFALQLPEPQQESWLLIYDPASGSTVWSKFDPEGLSAGSQVNDGLRYLSSVSFGEGYQAIAEVTGLAQAGAGLRNLATGNVSRGDLARATGLTGAGRLVSGDVSGGEFAAAAGVDHVGAGAARLANEGLSAGVLNDASEALPRATLTGAGVVGVGATAAKVSGLGKAAVTEAAEVNAANKASAQSTAPTQTASTTAAVSEGEAAAAAPSNASASLPQMKGMGAKERATVLNEAGFTKTKVSNSAGKNETWSHTDGSEVRVHPYGNVKQSPYKSGNNAHLHKQDPGGAQLNDRGIISTNPSETHIGLPNPGDFPQVRGRPHGS